MSNHQNTTTTAINQLEPDIRHIASLSVEARANKSLLVVDNKRTPIHVKWNNLYYSVQIKNPDASRKCCNKEKIDKVILNDISGEARPGELVAIMGPSGSGKTTLLNCLAKRLSFTKGSQLTGSITLNGVDREKLDSKFARIAAFVQQDDILFSMQTVDETLLTAAKLRLSKKVSLQEKQDRCNAIIQELGLNKCRDTRIGDAKNRGISGGERKRTNIGTEMIQDPSVLFLDEPTSGLDSFQALNVVETLKILCDSGCTVIMSIHQPRSSIFKLFDQLILLAEGKLVYAGNAGKEAVKYFSDLEFHCPEMFNPADYFLDIVSVDNRTSIDETTSKKRIAYLIDAFDKYKTRKQVEKLSKKSNGSENKNNEENEDASGGEVSLEKFLPKKTVTSSHWQQIKVLAVRATRQLIRDKFTLMIRMFMTLFFALFLSALYSEIDNGQKAIQDKQGILFFITINQSFGPLINTLNTFTIEKAIVMRERQAKSYHLSSYYLTKFFTSLPFEVIFPTIFGSIVYWIVNLKHDLASFLMFLVIIILCSFVSISMGFMIGSFAPNVDAANAIAPLFMILSILFGGFYINSDNIPDWIGWLENLSHIRWAYMAFAINEFSDSTFSGCDSGSTNCYSSGEDVLNLLSFGDWSLWEPIRNLLILFVCYHFVAYFTLRFKKDRYLEVRKADNKEKHYSVDMANMASSESKKNLLDSPNAATPSAVDHDDNDNENGDENKQSVPPITNE